MCWPQHADHAANAEQLRDQLRAGGFTGVVVLTGPQERRRRRAVRRCCGREYVQHWCASPANCPRSPGEPPRLYVVTRNAQTVLADDRANLEQAGLRGLLRVIGAEHPHLRATQIDVDDAHRRRAAGAPTAQRAPTRTRPPGATAQWYTARLCPSSAAPRGAANHRRRPRARRHAPADPHPRRSGDAGIRRLRPGSAGPGQIEVAVSASSINFADVLVAFGRYPTFDGRLPQLGIDFAGVVTAVGPDVTDHKVGDHVGGLSANGCWGTFVTCDARLAVTLPAGLTDDQAAAVTTAYGHRLVRPARPGPDQGRRQGADPLRDRRRRPGGDRDRPRRRRRDLRHRRQRGASSSCCATWESSTSTTRAASSSPSRSAATPTATASTSCSTR